MAKMTAGRWLGIGAAVLWLGAMMAARGGELVPGWSAGIARVEITPEKPVWMAGSVVRKTPSEGVAHPIHAKALALSDGSDRTAVLVTAVPEDPVKGVWRREVADESLHTIHNLQIMDFDGDSHDDVVLAAWEGVFVTICWNRGLASEARPWMIRGADLKYQTLI